MEFDGIALADELFRAYLQQIVVEGFSHGDPHPGNVFLMDNYCIALIDLGMVTMAQSWMQLAERVARMNIDLEAEHPADDNGGGEVIVLDRTHKN